MLKYCKQCAEGSRPSWDCTYHGHVCSFELGRAEWWSGGVVRKSLHHSAPPKPKTTQVPRRFQAPGLARRLEPFMMFGANSPTFCGWLIALCLHRPTDLLQILNLDLFNSHE